MILEMKEHKCWHGRIGNDIDSKTSISMIFLQNLFILNFHHIQTVSIESTVGIDSKTIKFAGGEVSLWDFAGRIHSHSPVFLLHRNIFILIFILISSAKKKLNCAVCVIFHSVFFHNACFYFFIHSVTFVSSGNPPFEIVHLISALIFHSLSKIVWILVMRLEVSWHALVFSLEQFRL